MTRGLGSAPCLMLMLAGASGARADAPHWFTDAPPGEEGKARRGRHEHGGYVEEGEGGKRLKRLWLRSGLGTAGDVFHAPPPALVGVYQVDPLGRSSELPKTSISHEGLAFPLTEEGFYATYVVERSVADGTLLVSVAKSEVLRHSCRDGRHDSQAIAERMPHHTLDAAPIELVRERLPDEDFHTELRSGDDLSFRVLRQGQPLVGAKVRVRTGQGWERTLVTDAEGRARFQMIRDYYPPWEDFQRRHRENLLVFAEHEEEQEGALDGQPYHRVRYLASFPASYLPSKADYASYAVGLGIGLGALVFTGLAVYLYRRRRVRPFQEVLAHG